MEELIRQFADTAGLVVEAVAVAIVLYGAIEAFIGLVPVFVQPRTSHGARKAIWRRFGTWLLLGLEFELAADIIGSVVSPSWDEVGKLGAIAAIRTFLNFFLERDLEKTDGIRPVDEHKQEEQWQMRRNRTS